MTGVGEWEGRETDLSRRSAATAKINTTYTFFVSWLNSKRGWQQEWKLPAPGSSSQLRTPASLCFQEGA